MTTGRPAQRRVRAVIGFAPAFPVWRSLALKQPLEDAECAEIMFLFVGARKNPAEIVRNAKARFETAGP